MINLSVADLSMIQDIPTYGWHCLKLHLQVKRTRIMMAVPPNNDTGNAAASSLLVLDNNVSNSSKCLGQLTGGQQRSLKKGLKPLKNLLKRFKWNPASSAINSSLKHPCFICSNFSVKHHCFIGRKPYHRLPTIGKKENKAGGRRLPWLLPFEMEFFDSNCFSASQG